MNFSIRTVCVAALLGAAWLAPAASAQDGPASDPAHEEATMNNLFYRPDPGMVADVVPYYWQGNFHMFYLFPCIGREGIVWNEVVTRDFVNFEEWGEVLPNGTKDEQDLDMCTGSVIEKDGVFHIFYPGNNRYFGEAGKANQVMMHATSTDLRHWTKDPEFRFPPATELGYAISAWRDPYVFFNDEEGVYWMIFTAQDMRTMPSQRMGVVALATSPDLVKWTMQEPIFAPGLFDSEECPDLFKMGDWWYLVFSTYLGPWATHYRMARSPRGPWLTPADDQFEAQAYYAAKTVTDGKDRYLCGWLTFREGEKDEGAWMWGGTMLVHKLTQQRDGTLTVSPPQALPEQFTAPAALEPQPRLGQWEIKGEGEKATYRADATQGLAALALGDLPTSAACMIEATVEFSKGTGQCGLMLRADPTLAKSYGVKLDPGRQQICLEAWPQSFNVSRAMTRPLELEPGHEIRLRIFIENTVVVIYVNDRVALSGRMYDLKQGALALYAAEGEAAFSDVRVLTRL